MMAAESTLFLVCVKSEAPSVLSSSVCPPTMLLRQSVPTHQGFTSQRLNSSACVAPRHLAAGCATLAANSHREAAPRYHPVLNTSRERHHRRWQPCHAQPEQKLPEDIKMELDEEGTGISYDEDSKTVKIPLSALQGESGTRRTKLVVFTCNKCGGRTARAVNPVAWEKGLVFGQCGQCNVWHVLASNNKAIYEEIRYSDEAGQDGAQPAEGQAEGQAGQQGSGTGSTP